jgi:hypothetical protein
LKACPGLGTPATPVPPRVVGRPGAAFRRANNVGIATMNDFGAEPSRPASLLSTLRPPVARPGARLATGPPAAALTGLDSHQLDSFEGFHRLISDPPFPRCSQRDSADILTFLCASRSESEKFAAQQQSRALTQKYPRYRHSVARMWLVLHLSKPRNCCGEPRDVTDDPLASPKWFFRGSFGYHSRCSALGSRGHQPRCRRIDRLTESLEALRRIIAQIRAG